MGGAPPAPTSYTIDATGLFLTITFDRAATGTGYLLWPDATGLTWPDGTAMQWPLGSGVTITVDGVAANVAYSSGDGTATWVYAITNGNPSGNPVLKDAVGLLSAAANIWTASGVGNAAVSGASVTNGSTQYNQGVFVLASNQFLSVASSAGLQPSSDVWYSAWVKLTAKAANQVVTGKWANTGNQRQTLLRYDTGTDRMVFTVSSNGTDSVTASANTFGAVSTGVWVHVFGWSDSVADVAGVAVNGQADSVAWATGVFATGTAAVRIGNREDSSIPLGGSIATVAWGKNPVGGFAVTPAATIAAALYNGGAGLRPSLISAGQRTAWGVVSGWLDTTLTGDVIGSNTLTNNNGVTLTTGAF